MNKRQRTALMAYERALSLVTLDYCEKISIIFKKNKWSWHWTEKPSASDILYSFQRLAKSMLKSIEDDPDIYNSRISSGRLTVSLFCWNREKDNECFNCYFSLEPETKSDSCYLRSINKET